MLEQTITLALRAVRHPQTGLAALLSGVAPALGARIGAVYLAPAGVGPTELLAVGGPDAAAVGPPGPIAGKTARMVRAFVLDSTAATGRSPSGQPPPWSSFTWHARISTPLPSGAACLLLVGADTAVDEDTLRKVSAPIALLAGAHAAAREVELLQRGMHELRQSQMLLAAGLQHDLRTPLTSIVGCARTLQASGARLAEHERAELLEIISSQADRLNTMIEEALGRDVEGSGTPLRLGPVSLLDVARKVASAAETGRGGDVQVDVQDTTLVTDPGRLERALLNLLDSALKYSPGGTPAHLIGSEAPSGFSFTVADSGPGVSPAVVPRLFSAYATDPARADGIGLGLHSVATLVSDLGGRVSYARREGWTRFTLSIPDLRDGTAPVPQVREAIS